MTTHPLKFLCFRVTFGRQIWYICTAAYEDYCSLCTHRALTGKGRFRPWWCWHVYLLGLNHAKKISREKLKELSPVGSESLYIYAYI